MFLYGELRNQSKDKSTTLHRKSKRNFKTESPEIGTRLFVSKVLPVADIPNLNREERKLVDYQHRLVERQESQNEQKIQKSSIRQNLSMPAVGPGPVSALKDFLRLMTC